MDVTHVRGMLFEEAVLYLLRLSGYRTIENHLHDPTLEPHTAGIAVVGRGAAHQIDAIADYLVGQPFSHPQRLLVEAKCFTNKKVVGLEVTRNAVGVLKDVSEFWATRDGLPAEHRRYHYQQAIFSATAFSGPAERYAFAHDIYLFPMAASSCFRGILDSIFGITRASFRRRGWKWNLHQLRMEVREHLRYGIDQNVPSPLFRGEFGPEWVRFSDEVFLIGGVVVALVARTFPLFLVPVNRGVLDRLEGQVDVRIKWNRRAGWRITTPDEQVLFSFDVPPVLFSLYAESGILTREQAALIKQQMIAELQAVIFRNDQLRLVNFRPEPNWFERLRDNSRDRAGGALPAR